MKWREFIFSDRTDHRWQRHAVFWLAWWLYFALSYYYFQNQSLAEESLAAQAGVIFMRSMLVLLTHMVACYVFIYWLLPIFLLKKKWALLIISAGLVSALMFGMGYLIYAFIFPTIDDVLNINPIVAKDTILWSSADAGILSAAKVVAAAVTIKLMKHWIMKQREKELLEKEKIMVEIQLLKAQMHPGFLLHALNNIQSLAEADSPKAPEILLKLSDLLSYMLYECNQPVVPLEKELTMMCDYMAIEKLGLEKELDMEIQIKGDCHEKKIAPFLLLPFIESAFMQCSNPLSARAWINLQIRVEDETLEVKLINGIYGISPTAHHLHNVIRRLQILYPDRHELRIESEGEISITQLNIFLGEWISISAVEESFNEFKPVFA